jgi:pimeloyl-ACP methyl ester carboxylesterase
MTPGPTRRTRRTTRPASPLIEHRTSVDGTRVFYRESRPARPDASAMVHLHGFAMSGRYLLPTAERLGSEFHVLVPDLPGCGRSGRPRTPLDLEDLAHATAAFMTDRGIPSATLVGHSVGCAVITELARLHPERLDRAVLVSPAGGLFNQPLARALQQIAADSLREPPGLLPVAALDYARFGLRSTQRLFRALRDDPSLEHLLDLQIPTLMVVGDRDLLMPGPFRLQRVVRESRSDALVVVVEGAAHAVNFSHPDELAHLIRLFVAGDPVGDETPGVARTYELRKDDPPTPSLRPPRP